jgi:hypothetical protein
MGVKLALSVYERPLIVSEKEMLKRMFGSVQVIVEIISLHTVERKSFTLF